MARSTSGCSRTPATTSRSSWSRAATSIRPEMQKGRVDVSADYLSSMTEYLNAQANGPDAEPVASSDPDATVEELRTLAEPTGIEPLEPARGAGRQRLRRDAGVRRRERPLHAERPGGAGRAGHARRRGGLPRARRVPGRAGERLRPRHHQGRAARLRHAGHQGRRREGRGRARSGRHHRRHPRLAGSGASSRTTSSSRMPRTSCRWSTATSSTSTPTSPTSSTRCRPD